MIFLGDRGDVQDLKMLEITVLEKKYEYSKFDFRLHKIQTIELVWPRVKNEERLPRNILKWCLPGRRKGIPQNLSKQEVTTEMRGMKLKT